MANLGKTHKNILKDLKMLVTMHHRLLSGLLCRLCLCRSLFFKYMGILKIGERRRKGDGDDMISRKFSESHILAEDFLSSPPMDFYMRETL